MLMIEHLTRRYDKLVAVDDVSFSIERGQVVTAQQLRYVCSEKGYHLAQYVSLDPVVNYGVYTCPTD